MKKSTIGFWILLVALVGLWAYFLFVGHHASSETLHAGEPAPAITVYSEADVPVALASLRGKVVLVHFWATWCGPCKQELPNLEKFLQRFKDQPDFIPLLVSEDLEGKKDTDPFRAHLGIKVPFHFDPASAAADAFGTYQIPETYLIDRSGRIVERWVGPMDWSDPKMAERVLDELLRQGVVIP